MVLADFKSTYFQHPTLNKVSGEPTYQSLSLLFTQVKANATSVSCTTLGGGQHGYLGLVISPVEYKRIMPGTPCVRAVQPAPFVVDGTAIVVQQS